MSDLLPYQMPCPKCGNPDVHRSFWARGERREAKAYNHAMGRSQSPRGWSVEAFRDHIVNHCRVCSHDWETRPVRKKREKV
jgi:hypothetical protein